MHSWSPPSVPVLPRPLRAAAVRLRDSANGNLQASPRGSTGLLWVCGITPYDATHLGHAATYLTFDLLVRTWRDGGHQVRYAQNVTDVDDPLLARAAETGEDWRELAAREVELFRQDMAALRVVPPDVYAAVSESMDLITAMIAELAAGGHSYELDGDVYFPIASAPGFGRVSNLDQRRMLELSRERGGDPDRPGKKDPLDTLLWRAARPGEPCWDSSFGPGRPGWHVECAALARHHLGDRIDVEGGGADLSFPHHEFTDAQAFALAGVAPFADVHLHQGMVGFEGHKMSKSLGNLVLVSRLREAGTDPMAIRVALLNHHYANDWEWTSGELTAAAARLARWRAAAAAPPIPAEALIANLRAALADDLDAPRALVAVDEWAGAALTAPTASRCAQPSLAAAAVDTLLGVAL